MNSGWVPQVRSLAETKLAWLEHFLAHFRASSPQISQKNAARPRHKTDGQVGQGCPRWVLGLLTNSWLPPTPSWAFKFSMVPALLRMYLREGSERWGVKEGRHFGKWKIPEKVFPPHSPPHSEDGKLTPEKRKRRRSVRPHNLRGGGGEDGICPRKQPRAHPEEKYVAFCT